jgi:uncharacterized protein
MLNHEVLAIRLDLRLKRATTARPSANVLAVAAMFGLGVDEARTQTIIPVMTLELRGGAVVFITGASGSGKSSLLGLIDAELAKRDDATVLRFDALDALPDLPLVDLFPNLSLPRTLEMLSLAGLNDAFVMLRRPCELSDGQRYRLKLAQAMATATATVRPESDRRLLVVLADELGATLDRVTAAVIARNIRKWVSSQSRVCFVGATTHDDLLEFLQPDVLIEKELGSGICVLDRMAASNGGDA